MRVCHHLRMADTRDPSTGKYPRPALPTCDACKVKCVYDGGSVSFHGPIVRVARSYTCPKCESISELIQEFDSTEC